jgi:aspartyl/asparaginyl beta-hydroxylase (cupin superfamily)
MNTVDDRRIALLVESITQALAQGRVQDAATLLRQAQAQAPNHPLVVNETAREMLAAGNPEGACKLLRDALDSHPTHSSMWLNLAVALQRLNRPEEEMAALDRVLILRPLDLRALLQKAMLQERRGEERAATQSYRDALRAVPPGIDLPASLRPMLHHAERAIAANNRALEEFLDQQLKAVRARHAGQAVDRFEQCVATLLQKEKIYRSQPTFLYYPRLPAIEFHDRRDFPWLDALEAAADDIRREFADLLADPTTLLDPYISHPAGNPQDPWKDLNQSRRWGVFYLWREGTAYEDHMARCPRTVAALESWPRWDIPGNGPTAMFSVLQPKTRIPPHNGVSNARLVVHLPLIVPPNCGFRVGAQRREWHPGQAFVFDDTIEHEAWNDSALPRSVLIVDIWNPHLSPAERDLVRAMTVAVGEYYGRPSIGSV